MSVFAFPMEKPTKIAVIADIHGNADALKAVLDDIKNRGITQIVNLGDHFSGPLAADETADILRQTPMMSLRGNHDRYLTETPPDDMHPSDKVAFDQLGDDDLVWLKTLPATAVLDKDVFLCHGTPLDDETYWLESVNADGSTRPASLPEIIERGPLPPYPVLICGHSHIPRILQLPASDQMIVNPGSVGCPAYDDDTPVWHIMQTGSPDARYAVLDRQPTGWTAELISVSYDTRRMADLAQKANRPGWAQAISSGYF